MLTFPDNARYFTLQPASAAVPRAPAQPRRHEVGSLPWLLQYQPPQASAQAVAVVDKPAPPADQGQFASPHASEEPWNGLSVGLHAQTTFIDAFQTEFKEMIGLHQSVRHAGQAAKDRQAMRQLAASYVFDLPFDRAPMDALASRLGLPLDVALGLGPQDVAFQLRRLGRKTSDRAGEMLCRLDRFTPAERADYRLAMQTFTVYVDACARRVEQM